MFDGISVVDLMCSDCKNVERHGFFLCRNVWHVEISPDCLTEPTSVGSLHMNLYALSIMINLL